MTKNPLINASAALLYIVLIASFIFFNPFNDLAIFETSQIASVILPISFLSLFVFSAATMGYLFLYQPMTLFLEGQKKEGVTLFLKTTGVFAALAVLLASCWITVLLLL